ncbi:MAG: HD domain-containing protein [bacterium]|nr:HD domain-containing protein [bacterium]
MAMLILIFIALLFLLQYFLYKKVKKVDKKIYTSIVQTAKFSAILKEINELSITDNFDFNDRIFDFLLDFSYNMLNPAFLIFYTYDKDKKAFNPLGYRTRVKSEFFLDLSEIDDVLSSCLESNGMEVFSKYEPKNCEIFPLINYFDSSVITKAIMLEGEPCGVMVFYADYDKIHLNILDIIVSYMESSLRKLEIESNINSILLDTLQALATIIDAKSYYMTKDSHSDRVTKYTKVILDRLDLRIYNIENFDKFRRNVVFAAMYHDIGKLGISDDILSKNTMLSKDERDIMATHPLIAEKILAPINFFKDILPYILYHHEHYNGTGYLYGLKGRSIPLGARILAVADAYDSMISDRSYKKAITKDEAITALKNNSGIKFDHNIVKNFLYYLEEQEMLF